MAASAFPYRRYAAELFGTFLLTFAVSASLTLDYPVPTPLIAALTLMVLAYLLGAVSGAHVNPAVTVGLFSLRKITFKDAGGYIVSQLLGAFLASLLLARMLDTRILQMPGITESIIGELIGAGVLAFGVTMVVHRRIHEAATGLVVGLSLFLGIAVASAGSLGIINPAVAIGLGVLDPAAGTGIATNALVYLLVPLIGGFLGSMLAAWFLQEKD